MVLDLNYSYFNILNNGISDLIVTATTRKPDAGIHVNTLQAILRGVENKLMFDYVFYLQAVLISGNLLPR